MKASKLSVLTACLLLVSGGALAQTDAEKAEAQRKSSEMMKPQTNTPSDKSSTVTPTTAEERKAQEQRQSSEMMKPQTDAPAAAPAGTPPTPISEADRKVQKDQKSSESMKPQ